MLALRYLCRSVSDDRIKKGMFQWFACIGGMDVEKRLKFIERTWGKLNLFVYISSRLGMSLRSKVLKINGSIRKGLCEWRIRIESKWV